MAIPPALRDTRFDCPPGGGGSPECPECTPGALTILCCPVEGLPGCDLTCIRSLLLKACNGVPPYEWEISLGNATVLQNEDDSSLAIISRGGGLSGVACANLGVQISYKDIGLCAAGGRLYEIGLGLIARNRVNCDGIPTNDAYGALAFVRGDVQLALDGGPTCLDAGIVPPGNLHSESTLDNIDNTTPGFVISGFVGPSDGSPVSLHVFFTSYATGLVYEHTFIINLEDDETEIIDDSILVDIRKASDIALGCTGCACDDGAPITVTVFDDNGDSVSIVVP